MATLFQPTREVKREGKAQSRKLLSNRSLESSQFLFFGPFGAASPATSIVYLRRRRIKVDPKDDAEDQSKILVNFRVDPPRFRHDSIGSLKQ
ncbi:hypothetical protein TNCV_4799431 [Trichonephila clavipes]|nr:hypothetical protein TNCV_4799431 [Trichonephila clavipes]